MIELQERTRNAIRDVLDFPKKGIVFKDITPILLDPALSRDLIEHMAAEWKSSTINAVAGIESRGFFFGPQIATLLGVPFIPIRKKGKLPYDTVSYAYQLEYGEAVVEMHSDAVRPGMQVLIHDDLLATGGTAMAAAELVSAQQGKAIGFSFLVELAFLEGTKHLTKYNVPVKSVITY